MITGRRGGKLKIDDSLKRPARDKICRAIIRDGVIIWRKLHAMFALHRRESTGAAVNKMKLRSSCCFLTFSVLCIGCHVIARLAVLLPRKGCCAFRVATLSSNPTPSGGISFQPKKIDQRVCHFKKRAHEALILFRCRVPPPSPPPPPPRPPPPISCRKKRVAGMRFSRIRKLVRHAVFFLLLVLLILLGTTYRFCCQGVRASSCPLPPKPGFGVYERERVFPAGVGLDSLSRNATNWLVFAIQPVGGDAAVVWLVED